MKTFKGTPAPWIIDYLDSENICIQLNSGTIEVWSTIEDHNGEKLTFEQSVANAKLIAAAPELLEALQTIKSILESPELIDAGDLRRITNAALNKAL